MTITFLVFGNGRKLELKLVVGINLLYELWTFFSEYLMLLVDLSHKQYWWAHVNLGKNKKTKHGI